MYRFVSGRLSAMALSMVAVLGLASLASAGEQVPFKGKLEGDAVSIVDDFPFRHVLVEGTGEATQLGKFTFAFPHTVHLPTRIAVGTYYFVAANGDKLTASGTGLSTPTLIDGVFYLYIVEEMIVDPTLSTGRFAGATGSFTVERLYNPATGLTIGAFEGTISSVGK
jgi:hypothetical protein